MEPTNPEIVRHLNESVNGRWIELDHLKMNNKEADNFENKIREVASQTAAEIYAPNELLGHNMPSLVEAARTYIRCFQAGVEYFPEESRNYLNHQEFDKEGKFIDKALVPYGINPIAYPNEEELNLMKKLGREAYLTGRAIGQIDQIQVNSYSLGLGIAKSLEPDSQKRVVENIETLTEIANVKVEEKNLKDRFNYLLKPLKESQTSSSL